MKKIDLEHHLFDRSAVTAFESRTEPPCIDKGTGYMQYTKHAGLPLGQKILPLLLEVAEGRIELMDRVGVDTAVLSTSMGVERLDTAESISVSKATNDAVAELCRRFPGRYLGSAALPVKDVGEACRELERCVKDYGFVCWHTHSNYGETFPDDAMYRPIFEKAAELGVYVYLHPDFPQYARYEGFGGTVTGPALGFTLDTVTTATRMILSGIYDEIPNLKVVLGHLGETLPFLLERMENRVKFLPNPFVKCKRDLAEYFKDNILVTTSGNMSAAAFECAKSVFGMDTITYGSDYPYEPLEDMMGFLASVPLTEAEREKVFYRNAVERLGIPA